MEMKPGEIKPTVRNTLKGYLSHYRIKTIHIVCLGDGRVYYSGPLDGFIAPSDCMLSFQKAVMKCEVLNKILHNGSNLFLFVNSVGQNT